MCNKDFLRFLLSFVTFFYNSAIFNYYITYMDIIKLEICKKGKSMINSVTGAGVNNQNYQMSFRAKGAKNKKVYQVIDKLNDEILMKNRSLDEIKETFLRNCLSKLKIKDLFVGKVVKLEETNPEHINTAIETANNASKTVYLDQLRKTNPELYKEVLRRDAIHKVGEM